MSKIIAILLLIATAAIVSQAKPYDATAAREVIKTKDPVAIRAYYTAVEPVNDGQKSNKVLWLVKADLMEKPETPVKSALEEIDEKAKEFGLADQDRIDMIKLQLLYGLREFETGYELAKTMQGPLVAKFRPNFARLLGKYDEAIAGFATVNDYYRATVCAYLAQNKLKTYEYGRKALLSSYQRNPAACGNILKWVLSFDYADTNITSDDLKELLVKVNRKYPPIGDDVKKWESFLAQVRFKLETYQD